MKFSCDSCHKRFSTTDEPVAGRLYRIPCRCGNTIVLQLDAAAVLAPPSPMRTAVPFPALRRSAPPPLPPRGPRPASPRAAPGPAVEAGWAAAEAVAIADDPFARAQENVDLRVLLAHASEDVTPTVLGAPLARRDPDASPDLSSAYVADSAEDPFFDELRRTRTHALALGGAAGAAVGGLCAAALTLIVLRPWSPAAYPGPAPSPDAELAQLASHRGPERPTAGRKAPVLRASAPAVAVPPPLAPAALAPAAPAPRVADAPVVAPAGVAGAPAPDASAPAAAPEGVEAAGVDVATDTAGETQGGGRATPAEPPADAVETPGPAESAPGARVAAEPAAEPSAAGVAGDSPVPPPP